MPTIEGVILDGRPMTLRNNKEGYAWKLNFRSYPELKAECKKAIGQTVRIEGMEVSEGYWGVASVKTLT